MDGQIGDMPWTEDSERKYGFLGIRNALFGHYGTLASRITKFPFQFYPQSGPLDGGTNVTIEGINLGRYFRDIENAVRINNVPCIPIEREYQPSTKIVCTTGPANHRKVQSGPIVVKLKDAIDYYALSDPGFDYVVSTHRAGAVGKLD